MDLKIKDVADLLNVPETTIEQWLMDGKIPAYRINDQYLFNRCEIEDWVLKKKIGKNNGPSSFEKQQKETTGLPADKAVRGGSKQFSLYRAIHKGGVFQEVPGSTKKEVIKATVSRIASELDMDAEVVADLLLERERLQSTALNNGIGLPHTRDCLLTTNQDVVTIVFPKNPIPYDALDGEPVHTLFFLFACEDKNHLHLLAKIAHFTSQQKTQELLRLKPSKQNLLEYIKDWESNIK
ncbi:MAG: Nitrogen regulatory protein [Chlamydiae bacterium]|nr:Nitrogen regulatory protein [Chlamydiota bacterium]